MTLIRTPLIERLKARIVVTPTGCWQWQGAVMPNGYGVIGKGGRGGGQFLVHRAAYQELVGPIPEGLVIDHLCRNRACCNPDHLEVVTHRENLMRGSGETSRNAAKTHCESGHAFTAENTYICKDGWRSCLICRAVAARRCRARKKAQTMRL